MLFGLLNRMIFWELVRVFLLALVALTGLFLIGGIIQQATQYGVSAGQLLRILPLLIPSFLPYTIPATMLFATCVVYGRLSHDNELVALQSTGVDLLTMIRPAFLLGVMAAATTAGLEYSIIPATQRMLQEEAIRDPEETVYNILKRERSFRAPRMQYVFYVRDVQERRLIDVVVKRKVPHKEGTEPAEVEYDLVARTREAELLIDLDKNTLTVDSKTPWSVRDPKALLDTQDNNPIAIALPDTLNPEKILASLRDRSQTLDWVDLPGRADDFERDTQRALLLKRIMMETRPGEPLSPAEQAEIAREHGLEAWQVPADPQERVKQVKHYSETAKYQLRTSRTMLWDYNSRPAFALGCLFFALLGCPIGIWANRADYLSMFVICFLPAVLIYYPLVMAGGGLARDGKVPMAPGVWAANAIAALAGVVLMWRLIRR